MDHHITLTGKINPVTGLMEYEQTPFIADTANPSNTVTYDVSFAANPWALMQHVPYQPLAQQGTVMFTPFPNHTTELASSIYSPCSIVDCPERANPLNAVESTLDVFGSPQVRVHLCDEHYRMFGSVTEEHEIVPDIAVEEKPLRTGGFAIVSEAGNVEFVDLPQGSSVYPAAKE